MKSPFTNSPTISVTRLGDLLNFGQNFKGLWQQLICPNCPHCKGTKIIHFYSEIIFGQLLRTFGDIFLVTLPQPLGTNIYKPFSTLPLPQGTLRKVSNLSIRLVIVITLAFTDQL